ncbi:hypothetical protein [Sphingomonas trueperi]|uniref:Uncharacterized protein n=1 Tax=Sphingomonas trueperi TaxID=53317 RepID=A0A7X6BFF8_9SPHN|nr:hypothetical protein [Sphingomonas trueperi]NJB99901.1 hypothetical protein [Sphingomonas trueperi]
MIFETVFVAVILALFHWIAGRNEPLARWMLAGIDTVLVLGAVLSGYYWDLFPRGHGYWTANRLSALALLLAAIYLPILAREVQERLSAPR